MNWTVTIILIVIVLWLTTRREPFTEIFGLSGYTKSPGVIRFDDPRPDLSNFKQVEVNINNDMMEKFVSQTNEEIQRRTGLCTYIIETTYVKRYTDGKQDLYECVFMVVRNSGFAFGFSVASLFEMSGDNAKLLSLRSQPLDANTPSDILPFVRGTSGQEFVKYELVREKAAPTRSELEEAKNKLQQL